MSRPGIVAFTTIAKSKTARMTSFAALANLTPERMAALKAGEAFVWSSKASDDAFSKGAMRIRCRPRVTEHGGATRVAVGDRSVDAHNRV